MVMKSNGEFQKARVFILVNAVEYVADAVVCKSIIKKSTGSVSVMSFDTGEGIAEKISPFDTYAQIIDGRAEIVIDGIISLLEIGEGIILPAHIPNSIKANERFKIVLTLIKSGYE